jgi:hypothetical protein
MQQSPPVASNGHGPLLFAASDQISISKTETPCADVLREALQSCCSTRIWKYCVIIVWSLLPDRNHRNLMIFHLSRGMSFPRLARLCAFGCSGLGLSRMRAARVWRSMVSCETAPEDHFPKDSDSWSNPRWTWRGEILQKFIGATWSHKNNILHGKARGTYITALTTWTRM